MSDQFTEHVSPTLAARQLSSLGMTAAGAIVLGSVRYADAKHHPHESATASPDAGDAEILLARHPDEQPPGCDGDASTLR